MAKRKEIDHAAENAKGWLASIEEMLEARDKFESCTSDHDDAEQTIHESVLSVQVRSGWYQPGVGREDREAAEYEILLTTGGPALRIVGQLGQYSEPETAELQTQDWGTPWTRYPAPEATLLEFARCFYFGEG